MRRLTVRCGKLYAAATAVYLLISLFGSALYLLLPPFLCSVGARFQAYLVYEAATQTGNGWLKVLAVVANVYVLSMVVFGIRAVFKGYSRAYPALLAGEVLLTGLFLLAEKTNNYAYTGGILVNVAYCAWSLRELNIARCAQRESMKKKGNKRNGKLQERVH